MTGTGAFAFGAFFSAVTALLIGWRRLTRQSELERAEELLRREFDALDHREPGALDRREPGALDRRNEDTP